MGPTVTLPITSLMGRLAHSASTGGRLRVAIGSAVALVGALAALAGLAALMAR